MFARSSTRRFAHAARACVLLMLAPAILFIGSPLDWLNTTPLCRMQCCSGLSPHESGSCSGGACHFDFDEGTGEHDLTAERAKDSTRRVATHDAEQHVEAPREAADHSSHSATEEVFGRGDTSLHTAHANEHEPHGSPEPSSPTRARLSAEWLTKPCALLCGAGSSASNFQRRPRDSATNVQFVRPRPPGPFDLARFSSNVPKASSVVLSLCGPRAPPPPSTS